MTCAENVMNANILGLAKLHILMLLFLLQEEEIIVSCVRNRIFNFTSDSVKKYHRYIIDLLFNILLLCLVYIRPKENILAYIYRKE